MVWSFFKVLNKISEVIAGHSIGRPGQRRGGGGGVIGLLPR